MAKFLKNICLNGFLARVLITGVAAIEEGSHDATPDIFDICILGMIPMMYVAFNGIDRKVRKNVDTIIRDYYSTFLIGVGICLPNVSFFASPFKRGEVFFGILVISTFLVPIFWMLCQWVYHLIHGTGKKYGYGFATIALSQFTLGSFVLLASWLIWGKLDNNFLYIGVPMLLSFCISSWLTIKEDVIVFVWFDMVLFVSIVDAILFSGNVFQAKGLLALALLHMSYVADRLFLVNTSETFVDRVKPQLSL